MPEKYAAFTIDVEQDCPPFLNSYLGIENGIPTLLHLLRLKKVKATFFVTGKIAEAYPKIIETILQDGHELGCHGHTHRSFQTLDYANAKDEIVRASRVLRTFAPVKSFRAPYLSFPKNFRPILEDQGYEIDSSSTRYKFPRETLQINARLKLIPVSVTSSALRLPKITRELLLKFVNKPPVLFVHPWEFVDFRKSNLRWDCKFNTGEVAVECIASIFDFYTQQNVQWVTLSELGERS